MSSENDIDSDILNIIGIGASASVSPMYEQNTLSHKRSLVLFIKLSAMYVLHYMCEVIFWLSASADKIHSTILFRECAPTLHVAAAVVSVKRTSHTHTHTHTHTDA